MAAITIVRFGFDWPTYPLSYYLAGFSLATALHITVYYFGGLYEHGPRLGRPPYLPRAALLTAVAVAAAGTVALLTGRYLMPRANLMVLAGAGSLLVALNRELARRIQRRRFGQPQVLLVGADDAVKQAKRHLSGMESGVRVAGQWSGASKDMAAEAERVGATDVLLLSGQRLESLYPQPLADLERGSVGVYRQVTPVDTLTALRRTSHVGGIPFVALKAQAVPTCRLKLKRLLDLFYLLVLAPVTVPLVALTAAWVRVRAGPGVIYRQTRLGLRGREFTMLKFRTMAPDAEADGLPVMSVSNDPRVVPGLNLLRRSRLDELPQLWNVLVGAMSIVGPRPERPEFAAEISKRVPGFDRRHDIPPGITGLAQIQGGYHTDPAFKVGHDLLYVMNWSPVLDWEIMVKTLAVMARG